MPSLGADMEAGTLAEWLVKPGDHVTRGDIIAVVDTQKGLIEIEVFDDGVIDRLVLEENQKVPVGTTMALIREPAGAAVKPAAIAAPPAATGPAGPSRQPAVQLGLPAAGKATPLARRLAAEAGIDLAGVLGTGPEGVINKEDVEREIRQRSGEGPKEVAAGAESIRAAVAAAMAKSNREIPHYYLETTVDLSRALAWLSQTNSERPVKERLLLVVLYIKALAKSLRQVPDLNAYWEKGLVRQQEINIGFAISLRTGGVLIPAIREADTKSLDELMGVLNELIPRARSLRLRSSELSKSTITMTNLGEGQVEKVFGVIYPPQVAILGFGGYSSRPWAENGMLGIRPAATITLAGDHRATDGTTGSRLLMAIREYLQKPEDL